MIFLNADNYDFYDARYTYYFFFGKISLFKRLNIAGIIKIIIISV